MRKIYLLLATVLVSITSMAQNVIVVDDVSKYTGTEQYVFNQADGKTYVRNNLGAYERYGVYEYVNTLTIKSATGTQEVEYLKNDNEAYIDLGYKPTRNTRIEAEFTAYEGGDWKALYGTRFEANTQNDVEFPGTANYSPGNGWKHGFAFFTTNGAVNLGGEVVEKDKMIFGERIKTIQNAATAELAIYKDGEQVNSIIDQEIVEEVAYPRPLTADCETSLYIFAINKHLPVIEGYNTDPNTLGANGDPCINRWVTLYSMKIYEGESLKYDLVPVLSNGKGGLKDKVSGNIFTSANDNDFVVPEESGITVYDGKVVIYNNKVYKYTDGALADLGELTKTAISETAYQNLNNWTTTDDHVDVFNGKIEYDETAGTNHIEHYTGTGGYEPLWTTIATEENQIYNFSFDFSCGAWNSWNADEKMKTFIFSDPDFGVTNNGYNNDRGQVLGEAYQMPTDETADLNVSIDFTAAAATSTLIYQFGYVDDGQDFRFYFDHLNVSKYNLPVYPALNPYKSQLELLIPQVEAAELNTTDAVKAALDDALAQAKAVVDGTDLVAQKNALETLQTQFALAKEVNVTLLKKIVDVAKAEGVNTDEAEDFIKNGTENALNKTIDALRVARKQAHFETETATYEGREPFEGDFYLLNVGRKNYLTSGSNWGTHLALGWPGLELTANANGEGYIFHFNELIPGFDGGARECAMTADYVDGENGWAITYVFEPIDGKPGVYAVKNTANNSYLGFDPDATPEGTKYFDSVTSFLPNADSEDAQWIIVTKDERLDQMEKASADNPVDVTVLIKDASFNKFATAGDPWIGIDQNWEFGNREFGDKNTEHYHNDGNVENLEQFSLTQEIVLPKAGVYELSVQAYFRDGEIGPHVEKVQNGEQLAESAVMFANENETPLMYIHEEADKAPGEGEQTAVGEFPNNMTMASKFFENGLYKNTLTFEVDDSEAAGGVIIGIDEMEGREKGSWIVADNFRLKYLGDGSEVNGVKECDKTDVKAGSEVAHNLFGQRVVKARKGAVVIKGGKKHIAK